MRTRRLDGRISTTELGEGNGLKWAHEHKCVGGCRQAGGVTAWIRASGLGGRKSSRVGNGQMGGAQAKIGGRT